MPRGPPTGREGSARSHQEGLVLWLLEKPHLFPHTDSPRAQGILRGDHRQTLSSAPRGMYSSLAISLHL